MALNEFLDIRAKDDPLERALSAHAAIELRQEEVDRLAAIRRDSIEDCVASGMAATKIADALNISRSRVSQLRSAGTKAQRAFFGSGRLTIAIGAKPEQGRSDDAAKYVVSREALKAFEVLAETAHGVGLDAVSEAVPPPGLVDLNRDNLVVLCSPRLLPFVGQVLAADSHLQFATDADGWYLHDTDTETDYRSKRDTEASRDYAYVGRLPRPDGHGTFLYLAGIHAEGTLGAAQWLVSNYLDLYKKLKIKRFSTLIAVDFDPKAETVTDTDRITPIYQQDLCALTLHLCRVDPSPTKISSSSVLRPASSSTARPLELTPAASMVCPGTRLSSVRRCTDDCSRGQRSRLLLPLPSKR